MAFRDSTADYATFAVGILSWLAMIGWLARALAKFGCRDRVRSAAAAVCEALFARKGGEVEDDVSLIVRAKVAQQKVHQFRWTGGCMSFFVGVWTLFIVMNISTGVERIMSTPQMVAFSVLQLLCTAMLLRPDFVTWKTIDLFYVALVASLSFGVSPIACDPVMVLQTVSSLDFAMTTLVLSRRSLAIVVPLNLLYAVSSSLTIWKHGDFCAARPLNVAAVHFILVMSIPIAGFLLETAMWTLLRSGIEMENTKELLGAACAVLRSVCDVMVELDASGVIVGPAHDLVTFLLKGPGFRFQNHKLVDFLSNDEDKRLFERKLHMDMPSGVGLAEALHVRMRDGDRNLVRVEIFSIKFRHLDSQPRFMVGLREFADNGSAAGRTRASLRVSETEEPPPANFDEQPADGALPEAARDVRRPSASSSGLSDSGSDMEGRGASYGTEATGDIMPAVVTVDTTSEGLPVIGWSAGFQMRVGRLPQGTRFLELLEPEKLTDFISWMNMAVRYGACWPSSRMTLNLRHGRVKASIRVFQEDEGETLDLERVGLLISSVKICRGHADQPKAAKPYTDFRGTPREGAMHMAL